MIAYRGWVVGLCLLGGAVRQASAGVEGLFEANPDGTFTYHYRVENPNGAFPIFGWSLGLTGFDWTPFDSSFSGDVIVPDGWVALPGIPVDTPVAQDFLSLDPSTDVPGGGVLDGFSFTSAFAPGRVPYLAFGDSATLSGTVVGPVGIVPEGGTRTAMLVLGGVVLAGWVPRRGHATLPHP